MKFDKWPGANRSFLEVLIMDWLMIPTVGVLVVTCFYVGSGAQEPKLHFGDRVKVVGGFYKGCAGAVRDIESGAFEVHLSCGDDYVGNVAIKETYLERVAI